ncbi:glycosaminoglycan xylosylkinase, partial [Penaeus vannamei]|uniref:glycosaminoglycan xylosylkinase n=1 Tax=Penaeus vannamei TaxID=6689 RepID=UPI00387F4D0E
MQMILQMVSGAPTREPAAWVLTSEFISWLGRVVHLWRLDQFRSNLSRTCAELQYAVPPRSSVDHKGPSRHLYLQPNAFETMTVTRNVLVCLFVAAFVSVNLFMANLTTGNAAQDRRFPQDEALASTMSSEHKDKVYLQGEVYAVREISHPGKYSSNRSGLSMLSSVYERLPEVMAQRPPVSSQLRDWVARLKHDLTQRRVADEPWALADEWATPESLVPAPAPGLGDVLDALSAAPITAADVGRGGTQLKLFLTLKGGQAAVFKPERINRSQIYDNVYGGPDRHEGEIAAFHLSRLLGLRMAPPTAGRSVSLQREVLPVSTQRLSSKFYTGKDGETCFRKGDSQRACETSHGLRGSVTLWLPERLGLREEPHPWRRTYLENRFAKWEHDENFCKDVLQNEHSQRLLHLMDLSVFDFLIQNGDRHNYAHFTGLSGSPVVLIDNGKSFGDAGVDFMDILAPVLQCCRLRRSTHARLVLLSGGGLSRALRELLRLDPLAPVL